MKHCKKTDCIYRAPKGAPNGCDYLIITGKSRILQHPPHLQEPAFCKLYIKGRRIGQKPFSSTSNYAPPKRDQTRHFGRYTYDWDLALRLEAQNASRKEIAQALGCSVDAVKSWRKRRKEEQK